MPGARADFLAGVRDVLPTLPPNLPFGVVVGVTTLQLGLSPAEVVGASAVLFAGASQLAALELVGDGAPVVVAVVTALLVNLRYTMYSAAIAPYVRRFPTRWKAVVSLFLIDVTFALSVARFRGSTETDRGWYYLGVALPLWTTWAVSLAIGAAFGAGLPDGLHLDFAVPLLFLALLFPNVEGRFTALAAGVAAVVAVGADGLPYNLGLVTAAVVGIAVGAGHEWRAEA